MKVKDDGTVKVLDFGLAKALGPDLSDLDAANSPTMTMTAAATKMGVIMGTAAYMSPEQAKGRQVDKRADIWAFGVVLFEMLTGRQAFGGTDISETLAFVLTREIEWSALPASTPASVRRLLRRCVTRDRKNRLADISVARLEIDDAESTAETPVGASVTSNAAPAIWQRPAGVAAIALTTLLAGALTVWTVSRPDPVPADPIRFTIVPPESAPFMSIRLSHDLAISPDGSAVVYNGSAASAAPTGLNLRAIDEFDAAPLRGGEDGVGPFFSPDGAWVGFTDLSQAILRKVSVLGGPPVTLTTIDDLIRGASWGLDDRIIFGTSGGGLFRVAAGGGEPEALTTLDADRNEVSHRAPSIIPGREAVLFFTTTQATSVLSTAQLAVLDLTTGNVTSLGLAGSSPRYVSTGHLVYAAEDGSLRAAPFDLESLEVSGDPVPIIEDVAVKPTGAADFDISVGGRLVYVVGGAGESAQLEFVWVDRAGGEEPVAADPAGYQEFDLSPDGTRIAVFTVGDTPALWIYDLARDTMTRLTFGSATGFGPAWTPDGTRVAFGTPLAWKRADGTGEVERLSDDVASFPESFAPDGATLVFRTEGGLGTLELEGDRAVTELLNDRGFIERGAEVSPDGRWLAYTSDESGRREVYVRPFPDVETGRWQISTDGGEWPVWNVADNELFYRGPTGVMALAYETDPTFRPGAVTQLLERVIVGGGNRRMAVSPDGERFLLLRDLSDRTAAADEAPTRIHVVLNWFEELLERVPVP